MYQARVLSLREREKVRDRWLEIRLEQLLPQLMEETDIDMWIVTSQEGNEDPVMKTLLPAPMLTSGRRTMLVFFRGPDGAVERLSIYRPGSCLDKFYRAMWLSNRDGDWSQFASLSPDKGIKNGNVGTPETQLECLKRVIDQRNPRKIGLNYSAATAFGDGISHSAFELIREGIGEENAARIVSAEPLAVRWLETRTREEMDAYQGIVMLTEKILAQGLSGDVIHPGVTTAEDLEWWLMQRCEDLGLRPWFPFMVALRRHGNVGLSGSVVIEEGDIIHCDVGLSYLGLCSDIQDNAYVLRRGETEPPKGIRDLFETGKRMQDIVTGQMALGRTGNEILSASLAQAEREAITGMVYSHPLGVYGHSAGPTIGLVDNQKFVKGMGCYPVHDNTAYALELNVYGPIPEWGGQTLMLGIETDILFTGGRVEYLYRQQALRLVR